MRFASLVFLLLFVYNESRGERRRYLPTTKGYYVFDNGIDTFCLIPNSEELYQMSYQFVEEVLGIKRDTSECMPKNSAFLGDSSTQIFYLGITEDGTGLSQLSACRDSIAVAKSIHEIRYFDADTSKVSFRTGGITGLKYLNDSTFTFFVATIPYFQKYCIGQISADLRQIQIIEKRLQMPSVDNSRYATRTYTFVAYAEDPKQ